MKKWVIFVGYFVVCALGVLFHFAYDFFKIDYLKIIFPSNESVFEHLKLFIFPTILYMIFDILIQKEKEGILASYISGLVVASVFMIAGYYTYSGIIGEDSPIINIMIFFVSVLIIFVYRYRKTTLFDGVNSVVAFVVFLLIIEIFSFYPTNIQLFQDPTNHEFPLKDLLNLLP